MASLTGEEEERDLVGKDEYQETQFLFVMTSY